MATHSSTLAWKIPWTEEPGRLQSMGSLRVGHDWATSLSCIGEGTGNLLQCSCLENPRDGGAWWATIYGVSQSWTRLKRLSSSSILWKITSERGSIIHSSTWMSIQCSNSQHIGGTVKKSEIIYLINLQSSWADLINRSEAIVNNISMLNAKLNGAFC